jgi:hypothetical protein
LEAKIMGTIHAVDIRCLDQAGWGVIWPHGIEPAVREALLPLLELRRQQAGDRFCEVTLRPEETCFDFLARYRVGPGPVDPRQLPYYLLLVGSPEQIPFVFQFCLDVKYGVGRIVFDDLESYETYARSVCAVECGIVRRPRRVSILGTANLGDQITRKCSEHLIQPLGQMASNFPWWGFETLTEEEASKEAFRRRLGGADTPALGFWACHGLTFSAAHPQQRALQGSLVCQEWRGSIAPTVLTEENSGFMSDQCYFAGSDIPDGADVAGLVAFFFSCFGAGTPKYEDVFSDSAGRRQLAEVPFVASLPQRLLGHPKGGALAVMGHVDRVWNYSFDWTRFGQIGHFESLIGQLLEGFPVGAARESFGQRHAELAVEIYIRKDALEFDDEVAGESDLIDLLGAFKEARSYVIIGDPAVRLAVQSDF